MTTVNVYVNGEPDSGTSPLAIAVADLSAKIATVLENQGKIMASIDQLKQDISDIKQREVDYIAKRDAIDEDLKKQLADAVATASQAMTDLSNAKADTAAAKAAADALQTGVDEAFAAAEEAKAVLAPPSEPPADTGGTTTPPADTGGDAGGTPQSHHRRR